MSYDVYLEIDTGGEYPCTVADIGNMTSNVAPMWDHALNATGTPGRLKDFGDYKMGMTGAEAAPLLERAVLHMEDPANHTTYRGMEPDNGWGSYKGALRCLRAILAACKEHPKAQLYFST